MMQPVCTLCVCIVLDSDCQVSVRFTRAGHGGRLSADFASQGESVHVVCMLDFGRGADYADFAKVCIVCVTQTLKKKVCTKSAQSLHSLHVFCIKSAYQP